MAMESARSYTSFEGTRRIVSADLATTLLQTKAVLDAGTDAPVLIFEDETGRQVDFDFRGTPAEVLERADAGKPRPGPGRPKLGVVSREVSLLPRHWDWLERQPNGISAALRRLVDEARKREPREERARLAREAACKFMWAMAGDFPGFEEASRALFAKDHTRFEERVGAWPEDVRSHLVRMVETVRRFEGADSVHEAQAAED